MRQITMLGVVGDADVLDFLSKSKGLGSVQQRKRNMFSQELEKMRKKKPF
jgi:hypothetical protein